MRLRIALIGVIHLVALMILLRTEYGRYAIAMAIITWTLLNCLWLLVLRSPGVSAALSLVLIAILIGLSQFKFEILQLALTFLDFLLIDSGTFAFLMSVFPRLKGYLIVSSIAVAFAIWLIWRLDPFRIRRSVAAAGAAICMMLIAAFAVAVPEQPWEPFQGVNHISNLARSGAVAVSHLVSTGWIEADAKSAGELPGLSAAPCEPPARRPHVILLLDESTSSLDGLNEQMLREAIDAVAENRTLIVIAHRLSTVVDSDQIIVLDHGHIVGTGTHAELVKSTPLYRDLAQHQLLT